MPVIEAISACPLTEGVELTKEFLLCGTVTSFADGEVIARPGSLGIIVDGSVRVMQNSPDDHSVILNVIPTGGVVGIAQMFSDVPISRLVASGRTRIYFIDREEFTKLIDENGVFAMNCIRYLSGRIRFLNRKIAGFTGYSTVSRLKFYLGQNAVRRGDGYVTDLPVSLTQLAQVLSVSRASLYRALDELEEGGLIRRNRTVITIPDIGALE